MMPPSYCVHAIKRWMGRRPFVAFLTALLFLMAIASHLLPTDNIIYVPLPHGFLRISFAGDSYGTALLVAGYVIVPLRILSQMALVIIVSHIGTTCIYNIVRQHVTLVSREQVASSIVGCALTPSVSLFIISHFVSFMLGHSPSTSVYDHFAWCAMEGLHLAFASHSVVVGRKVWAACVVATHIVMHAYVLPHTYDYGLLSLFLVTIALTCGHGFLLYRLGREA